METSKPCNWFDGGVCGRFSDVGEVGDTFCNPKCKGYEYSEHLKCFKCSKRKKCIYIELKMEKYCDANTNTQ